MIIVIGNGQSKSVSDFNLFKKHLTYGCDSIYRKFMPNHLICQNMNIQLELITNDFTKKHKCYFRGFNLIPSMHYQMLKQSVDKRLKIGENLPATDNFIQFILGIIIPFTMSAINPVIVVMCSSGIKTMLRNWIHRLTNKQEGVVVQQEMDCRN